MKYKTDIVIIGAGPVGIFAIFQAGMLGMKCHVVDILPNIGGQCSALYPEKPIYDIPGYSVITAQGLIDNLTAQASPFQPVYHLGEKVVEILDDNETSSMIIVIEDEHSKKKKTCKAVIIAAGGGYFQPNRPPLENILDYENKSVFYNVNKISDFADKQVVIAGGGDSAADWTVELSKVAKKIYVVHRRKEFRCISETAEKIKSLAEQGVIDLVTPYQLNKLFGENGKLSKILVKCIGSEEEKLLTADALLLFFGLSMEPGPILNWEIEIKHKHIVVNPATCKTSRDRVYAIGDISTYPGKLKLILSGFSEAAMACHDIYKVVFPDSPLNFHYSTSKGIPQIV
ncbi:MAG: NAD(P)/FAD-dependent oxidoreductase [Wolbachia endosymbiont of Xenopsylla cheopis]